MTPPGKTPPLTPVRAPASLNTAGSLPLPPVRQIELSSDDGERDTLEEASTPPRVRRSGIERPLAWVECQGKQFRLDPTIPAFEEIQGDLGQAPLPPPALQKCTVLETSEDSDLKILGKEARKVGNVYVDFCSQLEKTRDDIAAVRAAMDEIPDVLVPLVLNRCSIEQLEKILRFAAGDVKVKAQAEAKRKELSDVLRTLKAWRGLYDLKEVLQGLDVADEHLADKCLSLWRRLVALHRDPQRPRTVDTALQEVEAALARALSLESGWHGQRTSLDASRLQRALAPIGKEDSDARLVAASQLVEALQQVGKELDVSSSDFGRLGRLVDDIANTPALAACVVPALQQQIDKFGVAVENVLAQLRGEVDPDIAPRILGKQAWGSCRPIVQQEIWSVASQFERFDAALAPYCQSGEMPSQLRQRFKQAIQTGEGMSETWADVRAILLPRAHMLLGLREMTAEQALALEDRLEVALIRDGRPSQNASDLVKGMANWDAARLAVFDLVPGAQTLFSPKAVLMNCFREIAEHGSAARSAVPMPSGVGPLVVIPEAMAVASEILVPLTTPDVERFGGGLDRLPAIQRLAGWFVRGRQGRDYGLRILNRLPEVVDGRFQASLLKRGMRATIQGRFSSPPLTDDGNFFAAGLADHLLSLEDKFPGIAADLIREMQVFQGEFQGDNPNPALGPRVLEILKERNREVGLACERAYYGE